MRVIAGQARGVPLAAPPGRQTRPTSDRTKEAMFAVLGDLGCEGRVLDLFAGSGALGIEALSRGADHCDFVESSPAACRVLAGNLAKTRLASQGRIHRLPAERFIAAARRQGAAPYDAPYDLILLDPPYAMAHLETFLADLASSPLVGGGTALVVEHARQRTLPARLGSLVLTKTRAHGDSAFSLYLAAPEPAVVPSVGGEPLATTPSPTEADGHVQPPG